MSTSVSNTPTKGLEGVVVPPLEPVESQGPIDPDRLIRGVLELAGHVVATLDAEAVVANDVRAYLAATADGLHGRPRQAAA